MSGHGEKLSRKQEEAIAALLTTQTCASAAIDAKVNINTLTRWLKDEGFQEAYRQARYQILQETITRIVQSCLRAVETLNAVMDSSKATSSSRVAAARTMLEMAFRGTELDDFAARLAALEREVRHG